MTLVSGRPESSTFAGKREAARRRLNPPALNLEPSESPEIPLEPRTEGQFPQSNQPETARSTDPKNRPTFRRAARPPPGPVPRNASRRSPVPNARVTTFFSLTEETPSSLRFPLRAHSTRNTRRQTSRPSPEESPRRVSSSVALRGNASARRSSRHPPSRRPIRMTAAPATTRTASRPRPSACSRRPDCPVRSRGNRRRAPPRGHRFEPRARPRPRDAPPSTCRDSRRPPARFHAHPTIPSAARASTDRGDDTTSSRSPPPTAARALGRFPRGRSASAAGPAAAHAAAAGRTRRRRRTREGARGGAPAMQQLPEKRPRRVREAFGM